MYKIMTDNMADLPKEYFEIHASGMSAALNDFKECVIYGKILSNEKI